MAIAALIIGSATVAINLAIKSGSSNKTIASAVPLAEELMDKARVVAEANWIDIYTPPTGKGSANHYYFNSGALTLATGDETSDPLNTNGITYIRYFYIDNVNRTSCGRGNIDTVTSPTACTAAQTEVSEDPSTQKITVEVKVGASVILTLTEYITRRANEVTHDSDWSDIPGGDKTGVTTPPGEIVL